MEKVLSYLPSTPGLLPNWLLLVSITAAANSIQAYSTLHFNRQVYLGAAPKTKSSATDAYPASTSPATPLSSRTFGTWTFLAALVRFYAAYNMDNGPVYDLCMWTNAVAWLHFMGEWWGFGTARWGRGLAGPVFVSTGSLIWMWIVRGDYVA